MSNLPTMDETSDFELNVSSSPAKYGIVAIILHWLIAGLILATLGIGLYMEEAEKTPAIYKLYGLHKALGITILALAFIRLLWRSTHKPPALPAEIPPFERLLAHIGHKILYLLMLALPLSGWVMSSAAGYPVSVFGFFNAPNIVSQNQALFFQAKEAHEIIANALIAMIAVHVLAVIIHAIKKQNILGRMLPMIVVLLASIALMNDANAAKPPLNPNTPSWKINPSKSTLTFTANHNGSDVKGSFSDFNGKILFDPENFQRGEIEITVNVSKIDSSLPEVTKVLPSEMWFNADKFPKAVFKAQKFEGLAGKHHFETKGELTLHGITYPVTIDFTLHDVTANHATAVGKTTLLRNMFGIGAGDWTDTTIIKNEVLVEFSLDVTR
jgi:cytochrome b561